MKKRNFIVAFGREKITKYFGTISGIPTSFFIGPDGKLIVFKNTETGEEGSIFNGAFSKEILEALSSYPQHIEEIFAKVNKPPFEILSLITDLELKGLVETLPGKYVKLRN